MRSALVSSLRGLQRPFVRFPPCAGTRHFALKKKSKDKEVKPLPGKPIPVKVNFTVPKSYKMAMTGYGADELREIQIFRQNFPDPEDGIDLGIEDFKPYNISELVKDRLWRVRYYSQDVITFGEEADVEEFLNSFGVNLRNIDDVLKAIPEKMQSLCKEDYELNLRMRKEGVRSQLAGGCMGSIDMLVAKLDNGGLLLYQPVRLHPEMVEFLAERGEVKYIVTPDQANALWTPKIMKQYPDAKLISSDGMSAKLVQHAQINPHHLYTDADDLAKLRDLLGAEGLQMVPLLGESFNNPLAMLAHGHLLNVGLLFGGLDTGRHFSVTQEQWETPGWPGAKVRIQYYSAIRASPNGMLAPWRFAMMDPTTYHSKFTISQPKEDGSSSTSLAASLRELLKLDFEFSDDTMSNLPSSMPGDEFRKSVDATWNWLDGESLM